MTESEIKIWNQLSEAIAAKAQGKRIQVRYLLRAIDQYNLWGDWEDISPGTTWNVFDLETQQYRPKPEPARRPWSKPEDVPTGAVWLRRITCPQFMCMIVGLGSENLANSQDGTVSWENIYLFEWSTDRKTWLPCTVEEVA